MRYRRLGRRGPRISIIGLGFWQAGSRLWGNRGPGLSEKIEMIVREAYAHGITFYDTAEIYGGGLSEKTLGEAVRSLGLRDEVVVASKVAGYKWTIHSILKTVRRINRRLGFTVSLIQHHWPPPAYAPICRVIAGLEKAVAEGLAENYGLSNYNARLLRRALECTRRIEPLSNQVEYNLAYRSVENNLKPYMNRKELTLIAWSPLAKGALAGLRRPRTMAQRLDDVFRAAARDYELQNALGEISAKHGVSKATVALAWITAMNAIPIPGTRRPERIREYSAAGDLVLSSEELSRLNSVSEKYVRKWGTTYNRLRFNRYIPGIFQWLTILALGGA